MSFTAVGKQRMHVGIKEWLDVVLGVCENSLLIILYTVPGAIRGKGQLKLWLVESSHARGECEVLLIMEDSWSTLCHKREGNLPVKTIMTTGRQAGKLS